MKIMKKEAENDPILNNFTSIETVLEGPRALFDYSSEMNLHFLSVEEVHGASNNE